MFKIKLYLKNIYIIIALLILYLIKRSSLKKIDLNSNKFCCIISTNRSGASLLSSLICQNENVTLMDGIFGKKSPKKSFKNQYGHSYGFSESNIWKYINNVEKEADIHTDGYSIWSHPKFLSYFYKDRSLLEFLMKIELKLNILQHGHPNNQTYIIKDPYNILRLKLIKKILPKCKILINIRNYREFTESCFHLWSKNYNNLKFHKDISLHWYMSNLIAIFDSNMHFENIYMFNHEDFYDKNLSNQDIMKKLEIFLSLDNNHKYNFEEINDEKSFLKNKKNKINFTDITIEDLVRYEKELIVKHK